MEWLIQLASRYPNHANNVRMMHTIQFIYKKKGVNMYLPPVIWASSGLPPLKKKFRFQPCKIRFFDFSP